MSAVVEAGLDGTQFSAEYFPHSRRHKLGALVAYGIYRRSRGGYELPAETREQGRSAGDEAALDAWEGEGGRTS